MGRAGQAGGVVSGTGRGRCSLSRSQASSVKGVFGGGIFHVTVTFIYALSHIDLDHSRRRNEVLVRLIGLFAPHKIS